MLKNNIILCGFMGSGKTTIGKLLSKRLNIDFIDIDNEICSKLGISINQIFEIYGETYFRNLENCEVSLIAKLQSKVISTGGGTFLNKENVSKLSKSGKIFFLKASKNVIKSRLKDDCSRPLLKNLNDEAFDKLFYKRCQLYESICDIIIDANKSEQSVCQDIINFIENQKEDIQT